MTPEQRAIVLQLIAFLDGTTSDFYQTEKAIALLRELAQERGPASVTITWNDKGQRLVNGELAPEEK